MGRGQKSEAKPSAPSGKTKVEVELFMECVEEDLTPTQKAANSKAANEYNSALKQIEDAKTTKPATPAKVAKVATPAAAKVATPAVKGATPAAKGASSAKVTNGPKTSNKS